MSSKPAKTQYVAIAGGTSPSLGRSLTTAILKTYPSPNPLWHPIILSRSAEPPSWLTQFTPSSYTFIPSVSYTPSSPSLLSALAGVHTLISVILAKDPSTPHTDIHLALLSAAKQSGTVKRFVSSEWASGISGIRQVSLLKAAKSPFWDVMEEEGKRGEGGGIEMSRFNVGCFMNYLGIGCSEFLRTKGEDVGEEWEENARRGVDGEGDMEDGSGSFLVSVGKGNAELVVGDGGRDARITMTEIGNIGEFVAASLTLPSWPLDMDIAGCTIPLSSLISLCSTITGLKYDIKRLTRQDLQAQIDNLDPEDEGDMFKRMWLELKMIICSDKVGDAVLNPVVNELCPQVKALDVETYLRRFWTV